MKILLLGDYSNVHATLAEGLRRLGYEVVVASDGDNWKGYPRDVDLKRNSFSLLPTMVYLFKLWKRFLKFKNFDVVQIINPVFLPLKAERIWPYYRFLRKHNKSLFMGAFGMDRYYVKACLDGHTFKYSDFYIGNQKRDYRENAEFIRDWFDVGSGKKGELNTFVANDCDGIISGLYEYHVAYASEFSAKLVHIPFPISIKQGVRPKPDARNRKVKFFIGVQKKRSEYKGTDIMLRALRRVAAERPDDCEVKIAESVPFSQYRNMMDDSDVLLDQIYSYTPAMNALEAMSRGLVVVGGGEEEMYSLLGERKLRPIINVKPNENSVYEALIRLIEHKELVSEKSEESLEFICKYHDSVKVASEYVAFWKKQLEQRLWH